jgi:hypothetical protein
LKAQGNALGDFGQRTQALKGRNRTRVSPLQGEDIFSIPHPRALPWAIDFRPFGASERAAFNPLETAKNHISFALIDCGGRA